MVFMCQEFRGIKHGYMRFSMEPGFGASWVYVSRV